ncbi:MAG: hypothetical protein KC620_19530 [Myxococcales bacterium]|nr:hypothetical protein [Myxococcales bacterium]
MIEPASKPRPAVTEPAPAATPLYLFADVLDELRFNGGWRPDQLAGGLLIGRAFRDLEGAVYTEAAGFVAGAHVEDFAALTRHLRTRWREAIASLRTCLPQGEVIGWYAAVADAAAAPDPTAALLHNTFFNQPWQTGLWLAGDAPPKVVRAGADGVETLPAGVIAPSAAGR